MAEKREFVLTLDDGKELSCNILFTIHSDEFNKDYVVFKVLETNEITAACYTESTANSGDLSKVETDEEWSFLEDVLDDYYEKQNCDGDCAGCQGCQEVDDEE